MTATQLALGIFFGFGSLEVAKVGLAMYYERQKRNALKRDLTEVADTFIDKMHEDLMAERKTEYEKANKAVSKQVKKNQAARRKAAAQKPVAKKAPVKKTVTPKKGGKK